MIIDFHTHYFPDKLARDAVSHLEKKGSTKAFTAGTKSSLEESMRLAGIDISLNLPVATSAEQVVKINDFAIMNNRAPVFSFGAMHPEYAEPAKMISKLRNSGIRGIKMHPEYQGFSPDDPALDDIWKACVENCAYVYFHAGEDLGFAAPFRSDPAKFARLHRRFPGLKMILAHFGSWKMWDEVEAEIIGLPIFLETSFSTGFLDAGRLVSMIRKHGANRVLFGTDSPWRGQKEELDSLMKLPLEMCERELILWKNAARILDLLD